jgi:hypothetical protein
MVHPIARREKPSLDYLHKFETNRPGLVLGP